jgi:hypothetical protein
MSYGHLNEACHICLSLELTVLFSDTVSGFRFGLLLICRHTFSALWVNKTLTLILL